MMPGGQFGWVWRSGEMLPRFRMVRREKVEGGAEFCLVVDRWTGERHLVCCPACGRGPGAAGQECSAIRAGGPAG